MPYPIHEKIVIGIASSAIFDLSESDRVFREEGLSHYRRYTLDHENDPFRPGAAFQFIRRLLAVNDPAIGFEPIEVILLSKNDADTGLRVFNSIEHYGLPITRAAFTCGRKPYLYLDSFNSCLFLSAHEGDVADAVADRKPAGYILRADGEVGQEPAGLPDDEELRIAFDFDGIVADDSSERIFREDGMNGFYEHERLNRHLPMKPGPLLPLLEKISAIQKAEMRKGEENRSYRPRIRTALITARCAPAHTRAIKTLRGFGIHIDEAFFLGGIEKNRILSEFRPHIFFDDQRSHIEPASLLVPSVHVPYGAANQGAAR